MPFEAPPHEQQCDQHAHAHQLERARAVCLHIAELTPRAQAFLFEWVFDGLATIGARPRRGRWNERQLGHDAHVRWKVVEHAENTKEGIGSFLQQFSFAEGAQR